jgi:hypothetical protein
LLEKFLFICVPGSRWFEVVQRRACPPLSAVSVCAHPHLAESATRSGARQRDGDDREGMPFGPECGSGVPGCYGADASKHAARTVRFAHAPVARFERSPVLHWHAPLCAPGCRIVCSEDTAIVLTTTIDSSFCESWWDGRTDDESSPDSSDQPRERRCAGPRFRLFSTAMIRSLTATGRPLGDLGSSGCPVAAEGERLLLRHAARRLGRQASSSRPLDRDTAT